MKMIEKPNPVTVEQHFRNWEKMSVQTKAFEDHKAGEINNTHEGYWRRVYDAEINRLTSDNEAVSV